VGKSTLLNSLIGQRLSIVTPKAQTTRERVAGILTRDAYQILFIDAPGLIEPDYALQEAMRLEAGAAIEEADVIAYIGDVTRPATLSVEELASGLSAPVLVVLNKCDLVDGATVVGLADTVERQGFEVLSISAETGDGLDTLLDRIVPLLPESPPLFPEDESATRSVRFFVQEFVRETCLDLLRDEVPYSIACQVEEFRESQDPVYISVMIYVEKESQKGIVIGKGGAGIRKIGEVSRGKIEEVIGNRVYLDLRVKVMQGWRKKRKRLQQLGFRLPGRP
jgi:GTP-binding protein Era